MLEAIFDDFVNGRLKSICGTLPFIEIATAHRAAMIRTCCAVHSPNPDESEPKMSKSWIEIESL